MDAPCCKAWKPTGEFVYRRGFMGGLRLLIQEQREVRVFTDAFNTEGRIQMQYRWRKARFSDMAFLREKYAGDSDANGVVVIGQFR